MNLATGLVDPPAAANPDIYLVAAHPALQQSRVSRRLLEAAHGLARVQVRDLYAHYPDFVIDVAAEQAALSRAGLVVLLHPIQWYSMPPLQKLWLDEVLTYGWAYGEGGTGLRGKDLWLTVSTGGPQDSYHPEGYNRYFFDAFLPPYEQTAAICGLRFLPPLVLHGMHSGEQEPLDHYAETFAQRLASYPDWPEMEDLENCPSCVVPLHDRPTPREARLGKASRTAG
ncbi:MAG: NAD(P)H-dependent oxidoreductase [Polaromonas sp.]|nr:NAD(P)H-dependent oxidoreductase [Polaromonas sp.]